MIHGGIEKAKIWSSPFHSNNSAQYTIFWHKANI